MINEKLAELRMLRNAKSQDWRRFSRYCTFVHGEPSSDIFNYTVQLLHQDLTELRQTNTYPELETLSTELNTLLPQRKFSPENLSQPAPNLFKLIQNKTRQEMLGLLASPLTKTTYTPIEVQVIMSTVLENMHIQGWKVIVNENVSNMSVSQQKKQVTISSKNVAVGRLEDLIMHEIGRHVQRREKGEQSNLKLLGLGLDRYDKGEEGVATIAEQGLQKKFNDYSNLDRHLAIALARGVDGNPRDFKQVFIIMDKYYQFIEAKDGKKGEEAIILAKENAWEICVRVFRGTDCKSPGVCFTKDIAYALGNIDVWKVLGTNPNEMTKFTVGKYDPSNSRHIMILSQIGITDSDLNNLKE